VITANMLAWLQQLLASMFAMFGFENKTATIIILGLDNAGKTTLLHKMQTGKVLSFAPTEIARDEHFSFGGVTFRAWDLGGHEAVRHLWQDYCVGAGAVVFMVDSADRERLAEAATELASVLRLPGVEEVPVAVLLNKVRDARVTPSESLAPC
jgi:GTP-binding protein SAR1